MRGNVKKQSRKQRISTVERWNHACPSDEAKDLNVGIKFAIN